MTLIRSDRSNTSWMSWLMRKIPMPSSFSWRTRFRTWAVSAGPERRCRLVHDHDLRVEVDRPGDRDRLALAAGQRLDRLGEVREVGVEPTHDLAGLGLHARVVERAQAGRLLPAEEHVPGRVDVVGEREGLVDRLDVEALASRGLRIVTTWPSTRISPVSAGWAPDSTRISVDLPAPLPPTRPMTSPAWRSIDTSRTAWTPPNATSMFRISTIGVRSGDRRGCGLLLHGHEPRLRL